MCENTASRGGRVWTITGQTSRTEVTPSSISAFSLPGQPAHPHRRRACRLDRVLRADRPRAPERHGRARTVSDPAGNAKLSKGTQGGGSGLGMIRLGRRSLRWPQG